MKSRMVECCAAVNSGHPQNDAAKALGASESDCVQHTVVARNVAAHARGTRPLLQTGLSSGMIAPPLTSLDSEDHPHTIYV
jgi:hypothetical protein